MSKKIFQYGNDNDAVSFVYDAENDKAYMAESLNNGGELRPLTAVDFQNSALKLNLSGSAYQGELSAEISNGIE